MSEITLKELKESRKDLVEAIRSEVQGEIAESDATKRKDADYARVLKESEDLKKENARLIEAAVIRDAHAYAVKELAKSSIPEIAKTRIAESVTQKATVKEGALDVDAFKVVVEEAIKSETEYIKKLTGTSGVRGFGGPAAKSEASFDALKESFKTDYLREGRSEAEADRMAEVAAKGRR